MKTRLSFCALLVVVVSFVSLAQIDYQWINPAGGPFFDPANWNPSGIPMPPDRAYFGIPATYPVTLDKDWAVSRLVVDKGQVNLDLGGRRLDLTWTNPGDDAAVIGQHLLGKLLLTNGSVYSGTVTVGNQLNSLGILQVSDGGLWEARRNSDWQGMWIGSSHQGEMIVENGGIVRHGHGASAVMPNSWGQIDVMGEGSQWYVDGWFGMGVNGSSDLWVRDGGQAHAGRCEMGIEMGSDARAVFSMGSIWELTSFGETSLTIGQRGSATLIVAGDSQLLNNGNLAIAAEPGSSGFLGISTASATIRHTMAIGGTIDSPGGLGIVELDSSGVLLVGTGEADRLIIWPRGKLHTDYTSIIQSASSDSELKIILEGQLVGAGVITGSINHLNGILNPGKYSVFFNALQLNGDYMQHASAIFEVEMTGSAENQYSQLMIPVGKAVLDGNLRVHLADGYTPKNYEIFTILNAPEGVSGQFRNAPSTITFDRGTFDVTYTGDSVQLTGFRSIPFCDSTLPGDLNEDCRVDLQDLSLMAQNWLRCNLVPADLCQPQ